MQNMLTALGMTERATDDGANLVSLSGLNLPAIPSEIGAISRLVGDAIEEVAARIDPMFDRVDSNRTESEDKMTPRQIACNRMRQRLVVNKKTGVAIIRAVQFSAKEFRKNGQLMDIALEAQVELPEIGLVDVTPLVLLGINYIKRDDSGIFTSEGPFLCIFFRPLHGKNVYKALPLELCDPKLIAQWNDLVDRVPHKKWPKITHVKNTLRSPGGRFLSFTPRCFELMKYPDKQVTVRDRDGKKCFRNGKPMMKMVKNEFHIIGHLFGQMLKLSPTSQLPFENVFEKGKQVFEDDGSEVKKPITDKLVWRVKLGEGSLELTLLGRAGQVNLSENRLNDEEIRYEMNPFNALGVTARTVDLLTIERSARALLNRPFDKNNPLFLEAVNLTFVVEGDTHVRMRSQMEQLLNMALDQLFRHMKEAHKFVMLSLGKALRWPTIEEALNGRRLAAVKRSLNQPEDAVAKWIGTNLEEFDPSCPFHMQVRNEVLDKIAQKARYTDPERVKPTDVAKVTEEIAKVEEVVQQDLAPVAEVDPPTKKKRLPRKTAASNAQA